MTDFIPDPIADSYKIAINTLKRLGETSGQQGFTDMANLFEFSVMERAQLYGVLISMLLDKGIYEYSFDLDDYKAVYGYNLAMTPTEDGKFLNLTVKLPDLEIGEE